jgi:hypothetical protein
MPITTPRISQSGRKSSDKFRVMCSFDMVPFWALDRFEWLFVSTCEIH